MTNPTALAVLSRDLGAIIERAAASVVAVRSAHGVASGTVVALGRIVMANHGLDSEAETVQVLDRDRTYSARVVGRDPTLDLAVLAADEPNMSPLVGATATPPPVGTLVASVGRARDALVAGFGIVHAHVGPVTRRSGSRIDLLLRTTIAPYPGYSGGPLIAASGEPAGIATAGIQRGIGAALPFHLVSQTVDVLLTHGRIRRGFVGITSISVGLAPLQQGPDGEREGLLVTSLTADGPASRAGVLVGDVIVSFAGQALHGPEDLMTLLTATTIGSAVPLGIVRGMQSLSLTLNVGERGASSR